MTTVTVSQPFTIAIYELANHLRINAIPAAVFRSLAAMKIEKKKTEIKRM